jgi:hypothetical protein
MAREKNKKVVLGIEREKNRERERERDIILTMPIRYFSKN